MDSNLPVLARASTVHVLVDGANMSGLLFSTDYAGIDAAAFRSWCGAYGHPVIEWYQGAYPHVRAFHNVLRAAGIKVVAPLPKELPDGRHKCDLDVAIAVSAMRSIADHACVILVSGDGDFEPLVSELVAHRVRVVVVAQPGRLDPALLQHIDPADYVPLTDMLSYCGRTRHAA